MSAHDRPNGGESLDRSLRVFVSSTFQDMYEDREVLIKKVFPEIRRLCEQKGIEWSEVDLRWGITDEEKAEGKVLDICLDEIERCQVFIGLLGERYGWIPDPLPDDVLTRLPTLDGDRRRSVTEIEMLHALQWTRGSFRKALFYLRNPAYIQTRAHGDRRRFLEPTAWRPFSSLEGERSTKLAALKDRIRAGVGAVREYADPAQLAEWVRADLTEMVEQWFPRQSVADPDDEEDAAHAAIANSRTRAFVGRAKVLESLRRLAVSTGLPVVLSGPIGSGKTSVLAKLALDFGPDATNPLVFVHFPDAGSARAGLATLGRRLAAFFSRHLARHFEWPEEPQTVLSSFHALLFQAAAALRDQGMRGLLVLDEVAHLDLDSGAGPLAWLPPTIPGELLVVMSMPPGATLDEAKQRCFRIVEVPPLDLSERRDAISAYLGMYSKRLPPGAIERICGHAFATSPLFLLTLLNELRLHGRHETVGKKLDHFLRAKSIDDLLQIVLERWEADFEDDWPDLVRDTTTLLWATRKGLTEADLLDLVGPDLPRVDWTPLFETLRGHLLSIGGAFRLTTEAMATAIEKRYLPTPERRAAVHRKLATFFGSRIDQPRSLQELPWQLSRAGAWADLVATLTDSHLLEARFPGVWTDILTWWSQVEAYSEYRVASGYSRLVESPDAHEPAICFRVSVVLGQFGHLDASAVVLRSVVERASPDAEGLANLARVQLGKLLALQGKTAEACEILVAAEASSRDRRQPAIEQVVIHAQARIAFQQARIEDASRLLDRQERICRDFGLLAGLQECLGLRGAILCVKGDLRSARAVLLEQGALCRRIGDPVAQIDSLGQLAILLEALGQTGEALGALDNMEELALQVGAKVQLTLCWTLKASILCTQGSSDASRLLDRAGDLAAGTGIPALQAMVLAARTVIFAAPSPGPEAADQIEEAKRLARAAGMPAIESLLNGIGRDAGTDDPLPAAGNAERSGETARDPNSLAEWLHEQANEHLAARRFDAALEALAQAQGHSARAGNFRLQADGFSIKTEILEALEDWEGVIASSREIENLLRGTDSHALLGKALQIRAEAYHKMRRMEEALAALKEAEVHFLQDSARATYLESCQKLRENFLFMNALQLFDAGQHRAAYEAAKLHESFARRLSEPTYLALNQDLQTILISEIGLGCEGIRHRFQQELDRLPALARNARQSLLAEAIHDLYVHMTDELDARLRSFAGVPFEEAAWRAVVAEMIRLLPLHKRLFVDRGLFEVALAEICRQMSS